ncbi:uncharacterized protein [Halyomorpha halys]|nr:uncharacterized protein LOC106685305 isoform X2 [Halyomorpha halys]XP_014283383.1 uncharacterized protein LOC106685305 isoform X2 [Halyomorpha halys]
MDIIYKLPIEISEKIFFYLDEIALWRCLVISKYWRMVANQNRLWEEHCKAIAIEIDNDLEQSANDFNLCAAAQEWMSAKKRAHSWKKDNTKNFLLKSSPIAFHRNRLLFVNDIITVDLYSINLDGLKYLNKIELPQISYHTVSVLISGDMNANFIAVNTLEIVMIYSGYDNLTFHMALGIKNDKIIDVSDDIHSYLQFRKDANKDYYFEPICLCGNTLLVLLLGICLQMGPVYMVNLKKKEIIAVDLPFPYACAVPSKKYVYFGTAKEVVIFDTNGKISFKSDHFNLIDNNDNFVAELWQNEINVYALSSKKFTRKIKEIGKVSHVLAPSYPDYVFLLENVKPKIIAYSLKSGEKMWEREIKTFHPRDISLRFISGLIMAYCILPDEINRRVLGVFDARSGVEHDIDEIERYNYFMLKTIKGRMFIQYPY